MCKPICPQKPQNKLSVLLHCEKNESWGSLLFKAKKIIYLCSLGLGFLYWQQWQLAEVFGCWWRKGKYSFRPLPSCQWKRLFKIHWHHLSWTVTQTWELALLLKTPLLSPADNLEQTYILIRKQLLLFPQGWPCRFSCPMGADQINKNKIFVCQWIETSPGCFPTGSLPGYPESWRPTLRQEACQLQSPQ